MALVGRDEAEDLLARLFLKASERPPRTATNIRGWLARVLKNEAVDSLRSKQRRQAREQRLPKPENPFTPHELLEKSEAQNLVHQALQDLDEPNRLLLLMRYFQQLSPQEIAQNLNVSVPTVRVRLTRALGALRKRLRTKYGDQGIGYCFIATGPLNSTSSIIESAATPGFKRFGLSAKHSFLIIGVIAMGATWFVLQDDAQLGLDSGESLQFEVQLEKPTSPGSMESMGEGQSYRKRHSMSQSRWLELTDSAGDSVPQASVALMHKGLTSLGKEEPEGSGRYFFEIWPEGTRQSKEMAFLLITATGHAPYWSTVSPPTDGGLDVVLLEKEIVSGRLVLPPIPVNRPLFMNLGIGKIRPKINSVEYQWREQLTDVQKKHLDGAFRSCYSRVDEFGGFQIDGLPSNWSGSLRFVSGVFRLLNSKDDLGFQVIQLPGPQGNIQLPTELWPHLTGRLIPALGDALPGDLKILEFYSFASDSEARGLSYSPENGEFMVFFREIPDGPFKISISQGKLGGEIHISQTTSGEFLGDIQLPKLVDISFDFRDETGVALSDIALRNEGGNVLGVSEADGTLVLRVLGFPNKVWIDSGNWMPTVLDLSKDRGVVTLTPRYGIQLAILDSERKAKDGLPRTGFLPVFEVQISCREGLFSVPPLDDDLLVWLRDWSEIIREPNSGLITGLVGLSPVGGVLSACGVNPQGKLLVRAVSPDGVSTTREFPFSPIKRYEEYEITPREMDSSVETAKVVHPDGTPGSYSEIVLAGDDGASRLITADAYGEFSTDDISFGSRLLATKPGYESSDWFSLPKGRGAQGITLQLKLGRKVDVHIRNESDWGRDSHLKCFGIREKDDLVLGPATFADGIYSLEGCPTDEFVLGLETDTWQLLMPCLPGIAAVEFGSVPKELVHFNLSGLGIIPNSAKSLRISTSLGVWTAKSLLRDEGQPSVVSFAFPLLDEVVYLLGPLSSEATPEGLPLAFRNIGESVFLESIDTR
jgi:RNA polymerase sigma-70 factor, ECF subfamily